EEGMLGVLKFKKSLFAGVLDGGEKDVFLGGTRLNKFMETVEKTTAAIPAAQLEDAEEATRARAEADGRKPTRGRRSGKGGGGEEGAATGHEAGPAGDLWSGLLQAGMALLQQLTGRQAAGDDSVASLVRRDEQTGETYLKLPVPKPEVLDQALKAVTGLL